MTADRDALAALLAEHVLTNSFTTINGFKAARCACGEGFPVEWMGGRWQAEAERHRAHLADVLAPLVEQARREGAREALRDATDIKEDPVSAEHSRFCPCPVCDPAWWGLERTETARSGRAAG